MPLTVPTERICKTLSKLPVIVTSMKTSSSAIGRVLLFALLLISACNMYAATEGGGDAEIDFPLSLSHYESIEKQAGISDLAGTLLSRIKEEPFNLIATVIFGCAVVHTFLAGKIRNYAHHLQHEHEERIIHEGRTAGKKPYLNAKDDVCFKAEVMHFFGEVEAIFGIWVIPLIGSIVAFHGWGAMTHYFDHKVHFTEPVFVVIIMAIASTRPVLKFAETCLRIVASLGKCSPAAWWLSILTVGPILGSFITEPAAMTISALLLAKMFYDHKPSVKLMYATIGLLFVNVSVGGTLTHFAAPPVLMVAGKWDWNMQFMFTHFGFQAVVGILISNAIYFAYFRKEFDDLKNKVTSVPGYGRDNGEEPVPAWITVITIGAMAWTVLTLHHPPLFMGMFLVFLAFAMATRTHHDDISIKSPLLVGFFLAGLVTHGTLQQWWIAPVLSSLGELPLFIGATILTAFNDNAAITFLASQVPAFDPNLATNKELMMNLQHSVVAGAVTGGGLTVIANAPNPAGQSILQKYFPGGVSPLHLAVAALIPTIIMALCFLFLPTL